MRSVVFALAAAAALVGCQTVEHRPGIIEGAYPGEAIIYNGASTPIIDIWLRPTGDSEWIHVDGPDIPSGSKMGFNLHDLPVCLWDLKLETSGGEGEEYIGVDFCSVDSVRFPKA